MKRDEEALKRLAAMTEGLDDDSSNSEVPQAPAKRTRAGSNVSKASKASKASSQAEKKAVK